MNPWIAVVLVGLGTTAAFLFALYNLPSAGIPILVVTTAVSLLAAKAHQDTRVAYRTLRESMRPPSLVDEIEKKS
jgi:drug/metabolite transporter (DMT)-like permease